jgi:uncharacterized membrane protein
LLSNSIAYGIVIFNIVIREINIVLIQKIGLKTESALTHGIFLAIFVATFFNTAILILFTNADTDQSILSFLPLDGFYSDLD